MRKAMMAGLAAAVLAAPVSAQLLGGAGGGLLNGGPLSGVTQGVLGAAPAQQPPAGVPGPLLDPLSSTVAAVTRPLDPRALLAQRGERIAALVRANRDVLDMDDRGNAIRRDTIVGLGLTPDQLRQAVAAGFTVKDSEAIEGLGLQTAILVSAKGRPARKVIEALRRAVPDATFTLDPIYEPAGLALGAAAGVAAAAGTAPDEGTLRLGLIDGGVANHPAFAEARIAQRGFAGTAKPSGHGTAVASLMIGRSGAFHGAAPGAALFVADVYGGSAANGSAVAIARAMGWLAANGARVVNVSLVGPANPLLEAAVKALAAKGITVVAAVGNDGPAAPPQYPASYPGVVAVTGVDAKGRALIEAGRAAHLDFAAPGADMAGAVPGGGWQALRGTSFAAPLVAARLAQAGSLSALSAEAKPGQGRVGRGIVCGACAIPPKTLGIK